MPFNVDEADLIFLLSGGQDGEEGHQKHRYEYGRGGRGEALQLDAGHFVFARVARATQAGNHRAETLDDVLLAVERHEFAERGFLVGEI